MRQKLITLDLTSYELSQGMLNFSNWVREQLKHYENGHHVRDLLKQIERMEALLDDIRLNKRGWDGRSWNLIPPMHQDTEESE